MISKEKIRKIIVIIMVLVSMFQRILVSFVSAFSYYDEFVFLVSISVYNLIIIKTHEFRKFELKVFSLIIFLIMTGIMSNMISGYPRTTGLIVSCILVWFKSFFVFSCLERYFSTWRNGTKAVIISLARIVKILTVAAFIGYLSTPVTKFGLDMLPIRMRYGMHPYMFIYTQPALLSWYCLAYVMILILEMAVLEESQRKKNYKYMMMLSLVWVTSLRSRAFVFVACFWMLYFFLIFKKDGRIPKIKIQYVAGLGLLGPIAGWSGIKKYFLNSETTRAILLRTGFKIAGRYFPFGAGFANYATSASYKVYSPLYYYYGFNHIYRLNEVTDGSTELTDCYWPSVMGEMGTIGLILMIMLLVTVGKRMLDKGKCNIWVYLCSLLFIITSVFSTGATNVYSSDVMVLYVTLLALGFHMKGKSAEP